MNSRRTLIGRTGLICLIGLTSQLNSFAQETRGVAAPESTKGTVFKGKAPVASELLKVKFPRPREFKLSNGARVFVLEDHRLPTVRISLSVKAGTLFGAKPGVAEFTANMMN